MNPTAKIALLAESKALLNVPKDISVRGICAKFLDDTKDLAAIDEHAAFCLLMVLAISLIKTETAFTDSAELVKNLQNIISEILKENSNAN